MMMRMTKMAKRLTEADMAGKSVRERIEMICDEICNSLCKYPETWDAEKEGCELSESDVCDHCPLNFLN